MSFVRDEDHVKALIGSVKQVGHLHPVIVDADTGLTLSGRHRKFADPNWPEQKKQVKDDLDRELIILHANFQRQPSKEETQQRLLRIAQILEARGTEKSKICAEIVKLVPYGHAWVEQLMPKEYKSPTVPGNRNQKSSISRTSIIGKEAENEAKQIHTALDNITSRATGEPSLPFQDCQCQKCPHQTECY